MRFLLQLFKPLASKMFIVVLVSTAVVTGWKFATGTNTDTRKTNPEVTDRGSGNGNGNGNDDGNGLRPGAGTGAETVAGMDLTHTADGHGTDTAADLDAGTTGGPKACSALRITPNKLADETFIDPRITLVYTSPTEEGCGEFTLLKGRSKIATRVISEGKWPDPPGGFVVTRTVEAEAPLEPGSRYSVSWQNEVISTFKAGTRRKGSHEPATDLSLTLAPLPPQARISREDIDQKAIQSFAAIVSKGTTIKESLVLYGMTSDLGAINKPNARYAAHVQKLSYWSADVNGTPVMLSAMMVTPEQTTNGDKLDFGKVPVVLAQRGTILNSENVPSSGASLMGMLGVIAAGKGHLFVAPDLIGYGDSSGKPPAYLVAVDAAAQTADALRAATAYVEAKERTPLLKDLRLVGNSQGAHTTMAYLALLAAGDRPYPPGGNYTVKLVSLGAGPYDLQRTLDGAFRVEANGSRNDYAEKVERQAIPTFALPLLRALRDYEGYDLGQAQVFTPAHQFEPSFLDNFKAGPAEADRIRTLFRHLGANSLVNGLPALNLPDATITLYHDEKDRIVAARNTKDLRAELDKPRHTVGKIAPGSCREDSLMMDVAHGVVESDRLGLSALGKGQLSHTICTAMQFDDFVRELGGAAGPKLPSASASSPLGDARAAP